MTTSPLSPPAEKLPASYDKLVGVDQLQHGEHNPRCVRPQPELVRSIEQNGLQRPLVVRPSETGQQYHITDGWQRYQAATQLGWEQLPANIYQTTLSALQATETASIVREWSTYEWAQFCGSVASEVQAESHNRRAEAVAARVAKSVTSVERYLASIALPSEVHVLLSGGPDGSARDWQALANYNQNIRQYGNLPLRVAAKLGRQYRDEEVPPQRAIGLAANAVAYEQETAAQLIEQGCEQPELPLSTVKQLVQKCSTQGSYLRVPRVTVPLEQSQKQAIMSHCAETRRPLSQLVVRHIEELAQELQDSESTPTSER